MLRHAQNTEIHCLGCNRLAPCQCVTYFHGSILSNKCSYGIRDPWDISRRRVDKALQRRSFRRTLAGSVRLHVSESESVCLRLLLCIQYSCSLCVCALAQSSQFHNSIYSSHGWSFGRACSYAIYALHTAFVPVRKFCVRLWHYSATTLGAFRYTQTRQKKELIAPQALTACPIA